jgi:hypothetical protein
VPGQPPDFRAEVVDRSVDEGAPLRDTLHLGLHRLDPIVALIADLVDADELEIRLTVLQILETILEVRTPVVGDGGGVVLGRCEVLQRQQPLINGVVVLLALGVGFGETLLPALPPLRRTGLHTIEALEHLVEHAAGVRLHGSPRSLEPGKVGMGWGGLQIGPAGR